MPLILSLRRRVPMLVGFLVTALRCRPSRLFCRTAAAAAVLGPDDRLPAPPRDADLDLDARPSTTPGWPDLHWLQQVAQIAVVVGCLLLSVLPRGPKDAAAVAALGGAALIATQAVASYWFYPYICWWLPLIVLGPAAAPERRRVGRRPAMRYSSQSGPPSLSSPAA